MQCLQRIVLALLWLVAGEYGLAMDHEIVDPLQHIDFEDFNYGHTFSVDGTYNFFYQLPGLSSRSEKRTESGEVEGAYSFVAPEGDEFDFKYNAGKAGFRVESEALPVHPGDTDDVKRAKEEFFAAYEKALQMAGDYEYEEEEQEDGSEEGSEEESEEESSEESSEEYGEESSEEYGEDSSSEESSEEEEEEEGEEAAMLYKGFRFPNSFGGFGHPPPPSNFGGFAHRGRKPIPLSRH